MCFNRHSLHVNSSLEALAWECRQISSCIFQWRETTTLITILGEGKIERYSWTLTEYLSSHWEAIWYLQELSLQVVSHYEISFNIAVQVRSKNVQIAETLALVFCSQFWDIYHLFIKAIVLILSFPWRYCFQWNAPVESCVSPTGYKLRMGVIYFLGNFVD